ncbi:myb/SANT-like DNA-binding domain-containing protein 3 isoform X1 [Eriocheir sinensis]|uniref:myb/SANT-like DNA-binding domain-containing protein 3 isoform X1 n=1 Tax=Eriocheir sinensis TaxID=95602 RepID=UPI0021C6FB7B|nr:myb/SANT-like DNA-binding domain-containing protein 3 isoform X1 [Eriocheir sinensis]
MEPLCEAVKVEVGEEPTGGQASSTSQQPSVMDRVSDHSEGSLQWDEIGIKEEEEEVCIKDEGIEDFDPLTGYTVFAPMQKSNPRSTRVKKKKSAFIRKSFKTGGGPPQPLEDTGASSVKVCTTASFSERSASRSSPLSSVDKEMLVDLIKEYIEVINDRSMKFNAINKKAVAWQELARRFNDLTGNRKSPQQVRKIWENIRNRAKKDYSRNKAARGKTGGGPTPALFDPISVAVLPLIEDELGLVHQEWESDQGFHGQTALSVDDGSVTISVSEVEDNDTKDAGIAVTPSPPVPSPPADTRTGPSTSSQVGRCTKKKKLASQEKQEALRLATERNHLLREMDREVHQKRLELMEHEKRLATEHYANLSKLNENQLELIEIQKRYIREYHEENLARLKNH